MYVTELTYKIEKDGVEINKLTVSPGETVVSLTIKYIMIQTSMVYLEKKEQFIQLFL